ncbi:MAG TPA: hypothetical protein VK996_13830 [Ramlibacter sp.]|nr:hypothetical protein [Ramlibacter sp.]
MPDESRRVFNTGLLGSLLTLTLVHGLCRADALKGSVKSVARRWLHEMEDACARVSSGRMKPVEWQDAIATLLSRVAMADLLKAISYDQMSRNVAFPADHESTSRIYFHQAEGLPGALHFSAYLFALKKGGSVVPHGHHNMVTMHMMLKGQAHARHFDRVSDAADHLVIRPASDKVIVPGDVSSISDDRDNIHWFKALTEPVFMFNIGVHKVDASRPSGDRDYVDPLGGTALGNGLIRAPRLDKGQAYGRYGNA